MAGNQSRSKTARLLALCVGLVALTSCTITEGPPLASTSIEVAADLAAGTTDTYRFEVEAEAVGQGDEGFRVILSEPSVNDLSELGIAVERSWVRDGVEEDDWPERILIDAGELLVGDFYLTLTNNSQNQVGPQFKIAVTASPLGLGSQGSVERLRLAIRQR